MDMTTTIVPKSDQINADDLISGPRTIRVARVSANEGSPEQPINVFFEGDDGKPFRPCKSMRRVMVAAWGADANQYIGRSMTLYRDPKVKFGGIAVGGIRISHMSDIERDLTMALTETRAKRAAYKVQRLDVAQGATPDENGTHGAADAAREAAALGTEAFRAWYRDNPGMRAATKPLMGELKAAAEKADAAAADPFGLPPLPDDQPEPSEQDRARAYEEAMQAARCAEREALGEKE